MYSEVINTIQQDAQDVQSSSMAVTAYMCKQNWQPIGICSSKSYDDGISYVTKYVSTSTTRTTVSYTQGTTLILHLAKSIPKIKRLYVICPIAKIGSVAGKNQITLYMFQTGVDSPYCLIGKACSTSSVTDLFKWEQVDDYAIDVHIPIPQFCGLKNLLTIYRTNKYREIWPGNIGEITGDSMLLAIGETHDDHYTALSDDLIAGTDYPVFYKSRADGDDYHYLGKFRFETALLTSATIVGCGLVDKVTPDISGNADRYTLLPEPQLHINQYWTVKNDEQNFDNNVKQSGIYLSRGVDWKYMGGTEYTIEKLIFGGEGKNYKTYYSGEIDRFRWMAIYRGKTYYIKPVDYTPWKIGTQVYIGKNITNGATVYSINKAGIYKGDLTGWQWVADLGQQSEYTISGSVQFYSYLPSYNNFVDKYMAVLSDEVTFIGNSISSETITDDLSDTDMILQLKIENIGAATDND